jgi:hypothetical protein
MKKGSCKKSNKKIRKKEENKYRKMTKKEERERKKFSSRRMTNDLHSFVILLGLFFDWSFSLSHSLFHCLSSSISLPLFYFCLCLPFFSFLILSLSHSLFHFLYLFALLFFPHSFSFFFLSLSCFTKSIKQNSKHVECIVQALSLLEFMQVRKFRKTFLKK